MLWNKAGAKIRNTGTPKYRNSPDSLINEWEFF